MTHAFAALLAIAALHWASPAAAGRVHPDLESRLAGISQDALVPVIVELEEQADTKGAAKAHSFDRRARGRAVVDTLREVAERTQPAIRAILAQDQAAGEARKVKPFWVFNGVAVTANEKVIRKLAKRHDVREVRIDRSIPRPVPRPTSGPYVSAADPAWNIEFIRAPEVWALEGGYIGEGVVIGSFDTGVDGTHPELAPRYRGNNAISWFDPYGQHAAPYDGVGHGTHTVGTMVGRDLSGFSIGVAPGAQWIAAKGWDNSDNATASAFHEIFEWFLAPGGDPANAPQIVNSSWGMDTTLCETEFVTDVQAFRAAGILPVFAAGNSGPDPGTILSPGAYSTSFTVGATDFFDDISIFSSQGPSPCTGAVKPNISAPGEFILSTWPGGDYAYLDGTSMATPHVSGAAAVMLSIDPMLTVDELEATLLSGAMELGDPGPDNAFGYGRLDLMESARIALGIEKIGVLATTPTALELGTVAGVFTVSRTGATDAPLTLTYTVGGTALAGTDYVSLPGSITIPVGASSAPIFVTPIDDGVFEYDETIVVTLDPMPEYVVSPTTAAVTLVSDELPPDLVITALTAPATAGIGMPVTLGDTTRNQGSGAATASNTQYWLSFNNVLDAGDTLLGSRTVGALAAGASNGGSVTLTIPASMNAGTYFLFAKADGAEEVIEDHESNNLYAATIAIGSDLVISALTVPTDAGAGATIAASDTTRNQGAGTAGASTTNYYLSANATLDAADVLVGNRAVPSLATGATHTGSVTLTIPADTVTGTYYVFAKADGGEAVSEVSEVNNTSMRTLRVGPDLQVTAFSAPATAGAGATISVTDTTRNQGGGAAPASTTRYYLSPNNILDGGDVLLGSRAVVALAAGASNAGTLALTIPAGTASGSYYLFAKADGDDTLTETTENNNLFAVTIIIGGDLVVSSLTVPADGGAGQSITFTDTTRNQGAGTAAASTTTFYLSTDAALDAGDVVLGSRAVPELAAAASNTGTVTVTIPAATAAGTYYVYAKADAGAVVNETVETNNTAFRTLRIGPDLVITAFTAPATAGAGGTISVTDTTRNQGAGTAAASNTRYYLSANNVLDGGDVMLGGRAIPALAPATSNAGSVTLAIPAETASGAYYLFAKADGDNALAETAENNNLYATNITIGADLVISSFTAPTDGGAGLAMTLTDTTRNQSTGAAGASTTSYYLSANPLLDGADVLLGSRAVPALAASATDTGSVTVTIPAGTATGTYYVFAKADAGGVVSEVSEANNTSMRTVRVGPDLMTSMIVPPAAGAAATISVTDTTRNIGGGAAPGTNTRYYLSVNNVLDAGDTLLGARAVAALAPAASDTGSAALTIPAGTTSGTYYLFAKADGDDALAETQETNNLYSAPITIGPDLVVTSLTVPTDGGAGFAITFTDTTRNQGNGTTPVSTTTYYLSTDAALGGGDVVLGSRTVPALAAGVSDTGSVTVTIPAGTATGTYYVFAKADGDGVVSEVSEANNTSFRTLRVGPDLQITTFTAPASVAAGGTISVTETTRNLGGGAAPATTTRFYLSFNNVVDAGDAVLGGRTVVELAPGASETGSVTLTIPAGTASGFYYLFAKADGDGALLETAENNNLFAVVIQVTP